MLGETRPEHPTPMEQAVIDAHEFVASFAVAAIIVKLVEQDRKLQVDREVCGRERGGFERYSKIVEEQRFVNQQFGVIGVLNELQLGISA
tara:strand:- start:1175 stop:1444 length:270 start_codon:yes stop_codon:yes gene_type:complete